MLKLKIKIDYFIGLVLLFLIIIFLNIRFGNVILDKKNNFSSGIKNEVDMKKNVIIEGAQTKIVLEATNVLKEQKMIFSENFSEDVVLEESSKMEKSENLDWWVNSGAFLYFENGIGRTIFGPLEKKSKWQQEYKNSPIERFRETDGGFYPQNIFRLVTRTKWKNFKQEVYYKIRKYNLSKDRHRSASNGLLLFNRYQDGDNLYYTGLRVDGTVVVKKKYKGKYYLMDQKKILKGFYHKKNNPNLIPLDKWIGVRSEIRTIKNNQVEIKVSVNMNKEEEDWQEVVVVVDNGKRYGGKVILEKSYAGIRTDFMDVEFDDYRIEEVK